MRVTPLDIRKQEFRKGMRGLDADEVYAFLNTVADEYEAVLSDNKNLREKMVELEARLNEYRAIETNLRNTLVTAEKLTQEAKESAKRECALLIREAEMEAEKAAEAIRAHTSQLRREVFELKKNKDSYMTRLKTLLDTHRKMLDGFQEDFAGVDQAIEKIGQQVEEDARKGAAPPRMSREKITQEFAHEPKDKVTWGEERRREDEQRPSMPKPNWETREEPNQRTKPAEDANLFSAPAGAPGPGPQANVQPTTDDVSNGTDVHRTIARGIEQKLYPDLDMNQQPGLAQGAQAAPPQPSSAAAPQPRQDDWRQYEVRKQPVDWRSYEVQGQRPPQQQAHAQEAQSAIATDTEVDSALSSLREATEAANASAQVRPPAQQPAPRPAPAQAQTAQSAPQARPVEPVNAEPSTEPTWSMEDLRRNLTNLTKNEGDQR